MFVPANPWHYQLNYFNITDILKLLQLHLSKQYLLISEHYLCLFWNHMVPTWNNVVPAWNYKVPSWNYIVPTWNHMVPIKPVNLHFLILKYLRIGFSKNRFHIHHHKNMLIVSSTLKSWKIPTFFFEVEPYSSRLELYSSNLELYSSNLELYSSTS